MGSALAVVTNTRTGEELKRVIAAAGEAGPLIGETGGRAGTPPTAASGGQGHQRRQPPRLCPLWGGAGVRFLGG